MGTVWGEYADSMRKVSGMYGNCIVAVYLKYACSIRAVWNKYQKGRNEKYLSNTLQRVLKITVHLIGAKDHRSSSIFTSAVRNGEPVAGT